MSLTNEQVARRVKIISYIVPIGFLSPVVLMGIEAIFATGAKPIVPNIFFILPFISLLSALFYWFYLNFKYPEAIREMTKRNNKAAGGALSDRLEGMDTDILREKLGGIGQSQSPIETVKVRCAACKTLNDEADKFCGECGQGL